MSDHTALIQALSRLAGNRQSDGTSSLISGDDRTAIINGCHDLIAASKASPSSSLSVADRLEAEVKRLDDMPPSIQSQANIRLINAAHEAVAILRGAPTPATRKP